MQYKGGTKCFLLFCLEILLFFLFWFFFPSKIDIMQIDSYSGSFYLQKYSCLFCVCYDIERQAWYRYTIWICATGSPTWKPNELNTQLWNLSQTIQTSIVMTACICWQSALANRHLSIWVLWMGLTCLIFLERKWAQECNHSWFGGKFRYIAACTFLFPVSSIFWV